MNKTDFDNTSIYINRELSWLEFNNRVLDEARDKNNPLLERMKFLAISSSNLDEFFMVRVASISDRLQANINKKDFSGLDDEQQLKQIHLRAHEMVDLQYKILNKTLFPLLKKNNIYFINKSKISENQKLFLKDYFYSVISPVLTPMAVDASRPFPLIRNKSLNIGVLLKNKNDENSCLFATVQVPSVLPRLVELPPKGGKSGKYYILLEEVIMMFLDCLFLEQEIIGSYPYRITRNADLDYDEDEAEDLLKEIEKSIKKRQWGRAIRLEIFRSADSRMINILKNSLKISEDDIYFINGPVDLSCFMKMASIEGFENLKYEMYEPQIPRDLLGYENIFDAVKEKDILLFHPYESFEPVIDFIKMASEDPNVLAIKQTLYRVSGDSPIVEALSKAAEKGKQVMVLLEVKARFDEENNINWAKKLEQSGCHVIYGLVGLKTHCKITLVVRRECSGIKRYVHMGTGNYNDITAKLYTDNGFFTSNEYFGSDASAMFNVLSGYSDHSKFYKIETAPYGLRRKFMELIQNERQNAWDGKKAMIIAKMNSLVDPEIISELYHASQSGVEIKLIVRGVCCLRPKVRDVSENITVISIVGRFLEHDRVYYFYNNGNNDIYMSSADWMPRNLDRRVELLFPIENADLKVRLLNKLNVELNNNVKGRLLNSDGKYKSIDKRGKKIIDSQKYLCQIAIENANSFINEHIAYNN